MMRLLLVMAVLIGFGQSSSSQSLLNSFSTIAMQRCLAAVETGTAPRTRTLFSGEPTEGVLPEDIFAPIASWLTSDDRIYISVDARGSCAVGDTQAATDARAHETARRRFEAWGQEEANAGRYIDTNLAEETLAYRRTFVSTGWSGTPILVTLVSDAEAGLLALVAERSEVVVDDPEDPLPEGEDADAEPKEPSSNLLEKDPEAGDDVNSENSL